MRWYKVKLENIIITVTPIGNKFKFSAESDNQVVSFGVTETFSYNAMTRTFYASGMKLSGVKKVNF
jgi:hypothetical protein